MHGMTENLPERPTNPNAKAAPKADVDVYSQDGLSPAQAASKKSARPKPSADTKADAKADAAASEAPAAAAPQSTAPATAVTTPRPAQPSVAPQTAAPGQAGTTPGLEQTTPGEASTLTPAVTGTTPSGNATAAGQAAAQTKPVTRADVKAGATIFDSSGNSIGKVVSVSAQGAVVSTGSTQVTIPLKSLANGDKGLTIGMTKAEIEAAAKGKAKTK